MWFSEMGFLVSRVDEEVFMGGLAVGGFFTMVVLIVFIVCVSNAIRSIRVTRMRTDLAKTLAERGFSAPEIQNILIASTEGKAGPADVEVANASQFQNVPPQKPIVQATSN